MLKSIKCKITNDYNYYFPSKNKVIHIFKLIRSVMNDKNILLK